METWEQGLYRRHTRSLVDNAKCRGWGHLNLLIVWILPSHSQMKRTPWVRMNFLLRTHLRLRLANLEILVLLSVCCTIQIRKFKLDISFINLRLKSSLLRWKQPTSTWINSTANESNVFSCKTKTTYAHPEKIDCHDTKIVGRVNASIPKTTAITFFPTSIKLIARPM